MVVKLIVCIDGLGKDLISKENTPFLWRFGKDNYFAELETFFAFTGLEYSFFSGKTPRELGVWLEFVKSEDSIFNSWILQLTPRKLRDYFAGLLQLVKGRSWISGLHNIPNNKLRYFDAAVKEGLWKLDFFKNKKFVFYKWPFFVVDGKEGLVFSYEKDEKRLKRLLKRKKKNIYYTQLMEIDKVIHKFGKKSEEARKVLRKIDKILEICVRDFLKNHKKGKVFLWSDHGFVDIKNYIDLRGILFELKDCLYFIAGTTAHFWFKDERVGEEIVKKMKGIRGIKILNKRAAERFEIPFDRKYGDLIFYLKKGNYFFPNFYQGEGKKFKAMHGYPDDKELNGFLISNKKIGQKMKINNVLGVLG